MSAEGRITHSSFVCCIVGAVPPWLQDDPLEGTSGTTAYKHIGPSLQDFLKHSMNRPDISSSHPQGLSVIKSVSFFPEQQEKLRKLPPNRVGANFDHSSHTDANWLPSFGRVWNSGRRWQSR